jgi:hypothetical protein
MRRAGLIIALVLISLVLPWQGVFPGEKQPDLTGIWQSQFSSPFGMCTSETILMPKGQFSKKVVCGQMLITDTGTYTVGEGYIHFDIKDHEPKVYKGKPMQWVKSETVYFQFIGPDRLACHDRITNGRWEAVRVR